MADVQSESVNDKTGTVGAVSDVYTDGTVPEDADLQPGAADESAADAKEVDDKDSTSPTP